MFPALQVVSTTAFAFHVWYDGGTTFGILHHPGTTERCSLPCPVGFGCVVDVNSTEVCGRCGVNEVSPPYDTACQSCRFGDEASWGFWSSVIKTYLSPTEDQSRCVVTNRTQFLLKGVVYTSFGAAVILIAFAAWYVALLLREHQLHRLIRKAQWDKAAILLKTCDGEQDVAILVNRPGKDGAFVCVPTLLITYNTHVLRSQSCVIPSLSPPSRSSLSLFVA